MPPVDRNQDSRALAWTAAIEQLHRWHSQEDAASARAALEFIEVELRLTIPPQVRRTWPPEQIDDVIREFLTQLLETRPPEDIEKPRNYYRRAFRNRCIDVYRSRQRRREAPVQDLAALPDTSRDTRPDEGLRRQQEAQRVQEAVGRLPVADRVALKLVDAPEWLDEGELSWLSEQSGLDLTTLATALDQAQDVYALTLLFDPDPSGASDPSARRRRMERFRRRRGRARETLRELLAEAETP